MLPQKHFQNLGKTEKYVTLLPHAHSHSSTFKLIAADNKTALDMKLMLFWNIWAYVVKTFLALLRSTMKVLHCSIKVTTILICKSRE